MEQHAANEVCHVEILPPRQNTQKLLEDLERFDMKYRKILDAGYSICITDNAMGNLAFQGMELIEELNLPVKADQLMIHLNTFHSKKNLDEILISCADQGVVNLLAVSGDGNERLPRVTPEELGYPEATVVTSVELLHYINREYPGKFHLGVAFNPYEPEHHEFEKMERKIDAGAEFVITQPILGENEITRKLIDRFSVGYEIPQDSAFDPIAGLKQLQALYPNCGLYLALLGYKTQYPLLKEILV